jgi:tRNA threonylcarbamoyladenosine biosynthesis protein TsaE
VKTILLKNILELPSAAKSILEFAGGKKIFCFYGELGAGKTTLIKEICKQLGVKDSGSSPTFSLINEYDAGSGKVLYHFDLYRLKTEAEIFDIGYEEYLFSGNYCFIEWPEKIEKLLPKDVVKIRIEVNGSERIMSME